MTSQKDQIQSLIADIEQVLSREKPRTPWIKASETEPQRQALVRAQAYLMSLQQSFEAPGGWGPVDPTTGQFATVRSSAPTVGTTEIETADKEALDAESGAASDLDASAETVMQALLTEMKFLKSSALQPLRLEMDSLRADRDLLAQDVKELSEQRNEVLEELNQARLDRAQLESAQVVGLQGTDRIDIDRVDIDEAQLNQFLQMLMSRLQENLSTQVTQTLDQLESEHSQAMAKLTAATEIEILELKPSGQIEEIRQIQSRSDQLLANIDSTLQRMFETLQTNIDSYQISLNEGIENMHSLGRQGEVIVRSLVDHLTQQLGQTVPPEPAFYPARSTPLINEARSNADTVSSLNEILPANSAFVDESWYSASSVDDLDASYVATNPSITDLSATDPSVTNASTTDLLSTESLSLDDMSVVDTSPAESSSIGQFSESQFSENEADSSAAAYASEDFIREDGTIDIDLLKLDIDRTEEDSTLTRDDLMIDAAAADAQVADAETDLDVEAQVKPTADAAFLADLTFDDLVIDSETIGSETTGLEMADSEVADAEVAMPDFLANSEEPIDPTNSAFEDSSLVGPPATASNLELEAILPDLESSPSATSDVADSSTEVDVFLEGNFALEETAERPESAAVPDLPDSEVDGVLSDDLIAALEGNSRAAEEAAMEVDTNMDIATSDLEEVVVSDEDLSAIAFSYQTDLPLESALVPDLPDEAEETQVDETRAEETQANEPQVDDTQANLWETSEPRISLGPDSLNRELNQEPLEQEPLEQEPLEEQELLEQDILDQESLDQGNIGRTSLNQRSIPELPNVSSGFANQGLGLANTAGVAMTKVEGGIRMPQPPEDDDGDDDPTNGEPADWFLGIDLGATGISAVLINRRGDQVYPLCWNVSGDRETNRFRLPAVAQVDLNSPTGSQLGIIGPTALRQSAPLLRNLKLMAKAGIPNDQSSEPRMQWADHVALPLTTLQSAIVELIATLNSNRTSCRAVGLKSTALRRALVDLKGVIVGYPTNWPDTYSFNIREAVLSAGLVSSPDHIFFVEEAIAALLSALPAPESASDVPENQQPGLYNCNWSGGTVIISAGAILTETAVVNLPAELDQLSYQDFSMRGYNYAGDAIDQDIICQLLHLTPPATQARPAGYSPNRAVLDDIGRWETLGLDKVALPQPGEADRATRYRLGQRLNDSQLGREALLAAREIKLALQEEEEVEVEFGDYTWIITRRDLEARVLTPYIQRISRQVNALLSKNNLATQSVKQVVCTGGSASLGMIAQWLRQKFPNATIIQDTYTGEYSNSCSRVAYGLANLCHYPKVLDANRHQYNDYFLLLELLRILPEQPLPAGGILHMLEQRGIDTQACQAHVLALIEGHLPPGLVPTSGDRPLISAQSSDIATYRALSELPVFRKQGGQIYIADTQQGERLRSHLEGILETKAQSLSEPMTTAPLTSASVSTGE